MSQVNFASYQYVPVLGAAEVERLAYNNLRPETRQGILPVFEMVRHRGGVDFSQSRDLVLETVNLPFLLDLDKRLAPPPYQSQNPVDPIAEQQRVQRETIDNNQFNAYLNGLLSASDGFANWREFCGQFPHAVPVLQYTNPLQQANNILRQASFLAGGGNSIAMRVGQTHSDLLCNLAGQIISILPDASQLLLIFDCGQGRKGTSEKAAWVRECMQSVFSVIEPDSIADISAICMSNSYPQLGHSGIREVENFDRDIWMEACEDFHFGFGDYAANHRLSSLSAFLPRTYRATVVHSQSDRWITHRHENAGDPDGWVVGCSAIIAEGLFNPIASWTDSKIAEVAAAKVLGDMEAPRSWHAARISGHIERQFNYDPGFDEEDF